MALTPGYLSYDMRDTVAKAQSHNMLLVNGQATLEGYPGQSNGANCYIEKYFQSPVQNYAEVRTNYQNTDINRKVLHVRNRYFLLIDHLYGSSPQNYQWRLHGYGLEGGNAASGTFTDMTAANRSYWKRNNSGLFVHVISDVGHTFSKEINYQEFRYQTPSTHTTLQASSNTSTNATFMSCLQGFKNLSTDTLASNTLNIAGAAALKYADNGFTDIAVSKSNNDPISILKSTTGLANDFTTDAQFFWTSEKAANIIDLFIYKGTNLKVNNKQLFTTSQPMNIQYIQTGAKTYSGYCGDSGTIVFYTGEYTYLFTGENVRSVNYDSTTLAATVYFGGAGKFSFILDNSHLGIDELSVDKQNLTVFPNPANDRINFRLKISPSKNLKLLLFDLDGKIVAQTVVNAHTNEAIIDATALNNGIYFAMLADDSGNKSKAVKVCMMK